MDAVNEPPIDQVIRAAQDKLERAENHATVAGDPTSQHLYALRAFLTAIATSINLFQTTTKRDTLAIEAVQRSLRDSMDQAVAAARADVEKAHAVMAQSLVGSISARASAELAAMSRSIWWRTVIGGVAIAIAVLAIGFGAGYWRGYQVGHYDAATTIRSATPIANAVLADHGVRALHDWNMLMRDNPIVSVMSGCHGKNLAKQDGRTACKMWLWITPYIPPAAHSKN